MIKAEVKGYAADITLEKDNCKVYEQIVFLVSTQNSWCIVYIEYVLWANNFNAVKPTRRLLECLGYSELLFAIWPVQII